jgi:hypothetical protein
MKQWLQSITLGLKDMAGEKEFFLHQHVGVDVSSVKGLERWAAMPDWHALNDPNTVKVEPFGVHERQLHFIDLELFAKGSAKREYRDDLSGAPKLEDIPNNLKDPRYVQAGMLPLRVEQVYGELVNAIREKRMNGSGGNDDVSAARWAGYLAHYLEDNTQPQHATMDYKSATYFPHVRRAPNVHALIEYRMIDDEKNDYMTLRNEMWPLFEKELNEMQDPVKSDDLFQATCEVAMTSYTALPMIGKAAVAGFKDNDVDPEIFFRQKGTYLGKEMTVMEMKAYQLAWAVKRVERVWRQAWDEAQASSTSTKP